MRSVIPVGGAVIAAAALLSGCSGSSGAGITAGGASASADAQLTGQCQQIKQTVENVPGTLQQAATSGNPVRTIPRAIKNIRQELMSQADSAEADLSDAVQAYADNLQQVAQSVSSGRMPDLGNLDTSQINGVCAQVDVDVNMPTVSPSPTS
jgi:hypothetical protein